MHCNNLRLVLGLGFVRVSSRVRVRIRVKVRVSVMVRVSIRTSWVVNLTLFRSYRPVIYTRPPCYRYIWWDKIKTLLVINSHNGHYL